MGVDAAGGLDHPEVRQLGHLIGGQQDVGGLEIAVNEPPLVDVGQRLTEIAEDQLHGLEPVRARRSAPLVDAGV